jgi:(p)ppGpp synthase/HD superfamily hydrolase
MSRRRSPRGDDLLDGLLGAVRAARHDGDVRLLVRAYQAAAYWHRGQVRRSGDPYITHPVAVAVILTCMGADDPTLCAALLHDVLDDTGCTKAELRAEFGAEVAGLVSQMRALDSYDWRDGQAVSELPDELAGDTRALQIKIADRLHNMRTVRHLSPAKQVQKSLETLRVQVPLSRALGAAAASAELADLASATLGRQHRLPGASASLLCASASLLPASARARWREEWLAELHQLPTRRERLAFTRQIMLGIARLTLVLRSPRFRQPSP